MEYARTKISPNDNTRKWIEDHTTERRGLYKKPIRGFDKYENLKLYFQTDKIKVFKMITEDDDEEKIGIQIDDDDPDILSRSEFKQKYVDPALIWFDVNCEHVCGSLKMIENFAKYCHDYLNDDILLFDDKIFDK